MFGALSNPVSRRAIAAHERVFTARRCNSATNVGRTMPDQLRVMADILPFARCRYVGKYAAPIKPLFINPCRNHFFVRIGRCRARPQIFALRCFSSRARGMFERARFGEMHRPIARITRQRIIPDKRSRADRCARSVMRGKHSRGHVCRSRRRNWRRAQERGKRKYQS